MNTVFFFVASGRPIGDSMLGLDSVNPNANAGRTSEERT